MDNNYPSTVGSVDQLARKSDAELVATFLNGRKGQSREQRALDIIEKTGGLRGVVNPILIDQGLLTETESIALRTALEMSSRYTLEKFRTTSPLSSPQEVRQFLSLKMSHLQHEEFSAMLLDNRHRVIHYATLFKGTIDSAAVYPRECLKLCLKYSAAAVIFCHNHPSGIAEPSDTDVRLTRKLTDCLSLCDIRVLDHIIIGKGETTSLAERGLM